MTAPFVADPHRWPVPSESCGECGHYTGGHDPDGGGDCAWPDCACLLSRREAQWGRDEGMDDEIQAAIWEDAVMAGEPWTADEATP